jgi:hypothetical protein
MIQLISQNQDTEWTRHVTHIAQMKITYSILIRNSKCISSKEH